MRGNVLRTLVLAAAVLPVLVSNLAGASVHKIELSKGSVTDPETGAVTHKVLNPSGEVSLTFTNLGLKLEYVTAQKHAETLQIYIEFPAKPDAETEQQTIRNDIMEKVLQSQGKSLAGQLLRSMADGISTAGGNLILLIDTSGVVGFRRDHVTMDRVTLLIPGGSGTTLAQLLFNAVGPQAEEQAAEIVRQKNKNNPVGFMDGLPAAPVGGPKASVISCEALFLTSVK